MIRPHTDSTFQGLLGRVKRRQLFRLGFLAGTLLAVTEITALVVPFYKPNKILGLGAKIAVGTEDSVLATFKSTNDVPILNLEGKFFLIHPPGGSSPRTGSAPISGAAFRGTPRRTSFTAPATARSTTSP